MDMRSVGILCLIALLTYYYIQRFINKWKNPKCRGMLPPGSMGLPIIGETLQLLAPSYSLDLHPFIKKKIQKYGPIFKTNVVGHPVVVSVDPDFNNYIFQQEGRLVDLWYLDAFAKMFDIEGEGRAHTIDYAHKYFRNLVLSHIGVESIKEKLIPELEDMMNKTLDNWSTQPSIELKYATSNMVFGFTAKHLCGFDEDSVKSEERMGEMLIKLYEGLISFPLNIPGTAHYRCLKRGNKAFAILKKLVQERRNSPEKLRSDLLDQALNDMATRDFLTENTIVYTLLGVILASLEAISTTITLIIKFLSESPEVMEQLTAEHEAIFKNRDKSSSSLTWDEYKSMTFTFQVMNEALRFGNMVPGLLRKASKEIHVNGYTIPAGWTIMVVTSALHLNPEIYRDPFTFNPSRWKDLDPYTVSKNFMPFGGGVRQCMGAEFAKAFVATFLNVLISKYRWTKIKEGSLARSPILRFKGGIHIKLWKKTLGHTKS